MTTGTQHAQTICLHAGHRADAATGALARATPSGGVCHMDSQSETRPEPLVSPNPARATGSESIRCRGEEAPKNGSALDDPAIDAWARHAAAANGFGG